MSGINNNMVETNSSDRKKNHKHAAYSKANHTFHEMKSAQIRWKLHKYNKQHKIEHKFAKGDFETMVQDWVYSNKWHQQHYGRNKFKW